MDAVMRFLQQNEDRIRTRIGGAWAPFGKALDAHKQHWRVITVDCGQMEVKPKDGISGMLWAFGTWEPNISNWLRRTLKPGDGFIDLGANVGYYTLLAKKLVLDGPVWAFEASPTIYRQLVRNIELNNFDVVAYNFAVSDRDGEVSIHLGDNQGTANIFGGAPTEAVIPARSLDSVLADQDVSAVRVIKIDIEGAEDLALAGMQETWKRLPDAAEFMVELSTDLLQPRGVDPNSIVRMFEGRGYRAFRATNDYNLYSYRNADRYVPPQPFTGPVTGTIDLIFSRTSPV